MSGTIHPKNHIPLRSKRLASIREGKKNDIIEVKKDDNNKKKQKPIYKPHWELNPRRYMSPATKRFNKSIGLSTQRHAFSEIKRMRVEAIVANGGSMSNMLLKSQMKDVVKTVVRRFTSIGYGRFVTPEKLLYRLHREKLGLPVFVEDLPVKEIVVDSDYTMDSTITDPFKTKTIKNNNNVTNDNTLNAVVVTPKKQAVTKGKPTKPKGSTNQRSRVVVKRKESKKTHKVVNSCTKRKPGRPKGSTRKENKTQQE